MAANTDATPPAILDRAEYLERMRDCCTKNDDYRSEHRAKEAEIAELEKPNAGALSEADAATKARRLRQLRQHCDELKRDIAANEKALGVLRIKWTKYAETQWSSRYPRTGQPAARAAGSSPRGTFYTIDRLPPEVRSVADLKGLRERVRLELRDCKRKRKMLIAKYNMKKSKLRMQLVLKRLVAREWILYDRQIDLSETLRVVREREAAGVATLPEEAEPSMEVDTVDGDEEGTSSMDVDTDDDDDDDEDLESSAAESDTAEQDVVLDIDNDVLSRLRAIEQAPGEDSVIIDLTIDEERRPDPTVLYTLELAQPEVYNAFRIPAEYFPLPCGAIQELPSGNPDRSRRLHSQVIADSMRHHRGFEP